MILSKSGIRADDGPAAKATRRPAGRPYKKDTNRISVDIVQAAEHLFLERGYSGTTLDDVADLAGIAKHTIYRRFKSKEELFVRAVLSVFQKRFNPLPGPAVDTHSDPVALLKQLCRTEVDTVLDPRVIRLFRIAYNETQRLPEMTAMLRDKTMDDIVALLAPLVEAAQRAGRCMDGDPAFLAKHLLLSVTGLPFTRALLGATDLDSLEARDRYFDQAWDISGRMFLMPAPQSN